MSAYPKYENLTLSSDPANKIISHNEKIKKMHAFRISKMIGIYWSSKFIADSKKLGPDFDKLINPTYWFTPQDLNELPLTWNKLNFSKKSFTFGFN